MLFFSSTKKRLSIVFNKELPAEGRLWSAAEILCIWFSIFTILMFFVFGILQLMSIAIPLYLSKWIFPILISGMVGYMTNFIAIEMLFKPYHPVKWIPFWKQGLIPRNKSKISTQLGKGVADNLVRPDEVATLLCNKISNALQDDKIRQKACDFLQQQIVKHQGTIIEFLFPRIEKLVLDELEKHLTYDNLVVIINKILVPYLQNPDNCDKLARSITNSLNEKSEELAARFTPVLKNEIANYLENLEVDIGPWGLPVGSLIEKLNIADGLANSLVKKRTLELMLSKWFNNEETITMIREELLKLTDTLKEYLSAPETKLKFADFIENLRNNGKNYLQTVLKEKSEELCLYLQQPNIWNWLEDLLPKLVVLIEDSLREYAVPYITENFDIQNIVKSKIDAMNVEEFHALIDEATAEHLGAIQVLGYVLGVIVGAISLLVKG